MKIKNSEEVKTFLRNLGEKVGSTIKYGNAFRYIDDYYCEKYMGKQYLTMLADPNTLKTAGTPLSILDFIMLSAAILGIFYS